MEYGKIIRTFTSKKGNTVVFRYPKEDDIDVMLNFVNDLIVEDTFVRIRSLRSKLVTQEEEQEYLDCIIKEMDTDKKIHIAVAVNGIYVGNGDITRGDHRGEHVGLIILALAKAYRDEGIGDELVKLLIDQGKGMGLRLLTLHAFENNHRALHLYQKLGFRRAGMVPHAILFKGEYIGEVQMYLPLVETK